MHPGVCSRVQPQCNAHALRVQSCAGAHPRACAILCNADMSARDMHAGWTKRGRGRGPLHMLRCGRAMDVQVVCCSGLCYRVILGLPSGGLVSLPRENRPGSFNTQPQQGGAKPAPRSKEKNRR